MSKYSVPEVLVSLPWRAAPVVEVSEVERGVPIPARTMPRVTSRWLPVFSDLEVGESRTFSSSNTVRVRDAARGWGKKAGRKFTVRQDAQDHERARIWRVE